MAGDSEPPFYLPVGQEVEIFERAFEQRLPVLLKGPTGCGKTRFIEYMAWRIGDNRQQALDLITVPCHEDLTATDLIGRFLFDTDKTYWHDGPLTRAVRHGGLCYLDEVVEARRDTTVVIHPLTDHRRQLWIDKTGELISAHPDFLLTMSYNPGYQSILKDLKTSTRQRFICLTFDYPNVELESEIVRNESNTNDDLATNLAELAVKIRQLREHGFNEGVSTRLLIYAATLCKQGIDIHAAVETSITQAVTDDVDVQQAIRDLVSTMNL